MICDGDVEIIYKNGCPYGIRDESGYLLFFTKVSKYTGQENRYRKDVEQQYKLADYLLDKLILVNKI